MIRRCTEYDTTHTAQNDNTHMIILAAVEIRNMYPVCMQNCCASVTCYYYLRSIIHHNQPPARACGNSCHFCNVILPVLFIGAQRQGRAEFNALMSSFFSRRTQTLRTLLEQLLQLAADLGDESMSIIYCCCRGVVQKARSITEKKCVLARLYRRTS